MSAFRRACNAIQSPHRRVKGDLEHLRVLHLAASTVEADVEAALALLLSAGKPITADATKALAFTTVVAMPALGERFLSALPLRTESILRYVRSDSAAEPLTTP